MSDNYKCFPLKSHTYGSPTIAATQGERNTIVQISDGRMLWTIDATEETAEALEQCATQVRRYLAISESMKRLEEEVE